MTTEVLALTVFEIISEAFRKNPDTNQKCFRIKNLQPNEITSLISIWRDKPTTSPLTNVQLIVADDLENTIPSEFVAKNGHSITYYRNNNLNGLVYLETHVQSDEQGLQNLFTLRDINFLDNSFDEYSGKHGSVISLIISNSWKTVASSSTPTPSLLLERATKLINIIHPDIAPLPVRKLIKFTKELSLEWYNHKEPISSEIADILVGVCLWRLDLFPDIKWRFGDNDSKIKRRLELNFNHSELTSAGVELIPEDLEKLVSNTLFVGKHGESIPKLELLTFRDLCISYIHKPESLTQRSIPYFIFEQLFKRDTKGLKLGDKVYAEIESNHPSQLNTLKQSDVIPGLNARSQLDAERLLGLLGTGEQKLIADLLSTKTRKAVERLAAPAKKTFFNPAIELVSIYQRFISQDEQIKPAIIEIFSDYEEQSSNASYGLFAFLFAPTLISISESLADVPGGCELVLPSFLTSQHLVPDLEGDEEILDLEDDRDSIGWEPFSIGFRIKDCNGGILEEFDGAVWYPEQIQYFAFMWLLVSAPDSRIWESIGELALNEVQEDGHWVLPFIQRLTSLDKIAPTENSVHNGTDQVLDNLLTLRKTLQTNLNSDGLAVEHIYSFLDEWERILVSISTDYVPDGSRSSTLQAFLGNDTLIVKEQDRRFMLPLQPIRLRWIAEYLDKCRRLATSCLQGNAKFATADGEQYLSWLEALTPHESPPTTSGLAGEILFARSELAWFEDFSPLRKVTSDVSIDTSALDSIASRITSYLDAHPYKREGLSLLAILPPSDDMVAELVRKISRGSLSGLRVSITVAAPRSRWEQITKDIEKLPMEERASHKGLFFPARDLAFIDYTLGDNLPELLGDQLYDIALVTHILQEHITSQTNTEPPIERKGRFHPLFDRPVRLDPSNDGGSISIAMRPRDPDLLLETWGTIVVRSDRCRPVSPTQPENTDFVELRVNFQDSARIFQILHTSCHWVITLERHISREQIESVEAGAPDILSMETGIGGNGLNTIIVSSRSGRTLIESRLSRKLHRLIPDIEDTEIANDIVKYLAQRIYEETRQLSPHLALKAMGIARVTEEILGLSVARRVAEQLFPVELKDGISVWISLDEHSEWLRGFQVRADMARITFRRVDPDALHIDVLILEGKLRQLFDPHGIVQVKRTCEFFASILENNMDGGTKIDGDLWRERIMAAIESVAKEAIRSVNVTSSKINLVTDTIPNDIRQLFRDGKYSLNSVKGLYSSCLWENVEGDITTEERDGVLVVKTTRSLILELISRPENFNTPEIGATGSLEPEEGPAIIYSQDTTNKFDTIAMLQNSEAENIGILLESAPIPQLASSSKRLRMDEAALRHIYNEILACFSAHNINVIAASHSETPYIEGPASILFKVRTGAGVDPKKLFEKSQALKLKLELDQEQNITFDIDKGFVTIDVPKAAELRYFVNAVDLWKNWTVEKDALSAPIGEDQLGEVVSINFSSANSPHLLVAGTTGSGKSEALNAILFGLTNFFNPSELKLLLVDPKGTEMRAFEGCDYLHGQIGWEDSDAIVLLKEAVEEMQRRYTLFRTSGCRSLGEFNSKVSFSERLPWWLIVLDEYADLTHDSQNKKEIEQELKRLAQKARAAGIHLIIATQKPSADVISTNLRSNLPAQLALRVKSGTESRVILDEAGAENLNGKGDALLKADGKLRRVQCAYVGKDDQQLRKS
ncbi:FtsK/SpoIIIE domain-containing protein [Pseudomonas sp. PMCC200344]|uniref:FtsK/SpoIIIE domain-containing protein n=1 Tax=Pseudomonas sp. PMCC200344 TaxID=3042028 RepID=UPI0024B38404|nr:FtsK/SpoIIIE domain-containing protein [Pseudomonas sp. PMCC200344]